MSLSRIRYYKINNLKTTIFFSNDIKLDKQQIINYVSKIENIHNIFFQNIKGESYFIFLLNPKYEYDLDGAQTSNFQTIALGNKAKFDYDTKRIIAHENLHNWFNPKIFGEYENEQGYNCWLIEGFTDYYTDYLNYKFGIISLNEYLDIYNKVLLEYYTSPFRYLKNDEVGKNVYDTEIFSIAYLRGRIIAHELNYLIQKNTEGRQDLDCYIKYLTQFMTLNPKTRFDLNTLTKTLMNFTGHDLSEFINSVAQNNILVTAPYILSNKAILTLQKAQEITYDFDFVRSRLEWKIYGVDNKSQAFKSGLRTEQQVLSIDTTTQGDLSFKVKDKNGIKTIKVPQKCKEILVPSYKYFLIK